MSINDLAATTLNGDSVPLAEYGGSVLLIVNTASECGFTPQFEGLQELWRDYREAGLVVLGFPCNQFGHQDPGSNEEIWRFCHENYGVTFPMMAKVEVNGPNADPIFRWLTDEAPGLLGSKRIKWNFTKFLVSRDGRHVRRFPPTTDPGMLRAAIEAALAETS